MEDRKDNPPEENAKLDTNGMCRGRSSILHVENDDNTNSGLRSTQSEQYTSEKNLQADDQCSSGGTSPEDATCSICLFEYNNKADLDKCCRILLTSEI